MMVSCEKCWKDANSNPEIYTQLIKERNVNPCTPEEQAGEYARVCPRCKRITVHQYTKECVICHGDKGNKLSHIKS